MIQVEDKPCLYCKRPIGHGAFWSGPYHVDCYHRKTFWRRLWRKIKLPFRRLAEEWREQVLDRLED